MATAFMVLVLVDSFSFLFKHSGELVLQIFNPYKIDLTNNTLAANEEFPTLVSIYPGS